MQVAKYNVNVRETAPVLTCNLFVLAKLVVPLLHHDYY